MASLLRFDGSKKRPERAVRSKSLAELLAEAGFWAHGGRWGGVGGMGWGCRWGGRGVHCFANVPFQVGLKFEGKPTENATFETEPNG